MALRWIEGFEGFGALTGASLITEVGKKYDATSMSSSVLRAGRGGGSSLQIGITQSQFIVKTFDDQQTWVVGFAFHTPASFSGTSRPMITLLDGGSSGTVQMHLRLFNDGLSIDRNGTVLDTIPTLFVTSTWYYIEFKVKIDNAVGTYEAKVNGSSVGTPGSSADTQYTANAYADSVKIWNTEGQPWYDDIYILDATGGENDDFLGEMKVEILLPTSDSISADWSLSTGSDHYALVDENPSDEDTTYVYSTTSADVDLYNYDDIGSAFQTIYGVQINTQAKVSSAASIDMYMPVSSGSTVSNGTSVTVSDTTYKIFGRAIGLDPDTSALWLSGAVDAALFGVKIV